MNTNKDPASVVEQVAVKNGEEECGVRNISEINEMPKLSLA